MGILLAGVRHGGGDDVPDVARRGVELLFADVPDEARGAAHHGDAAHDFLRHADFAQQRGDRAGGVDGQVPAPRRVDLFRQQAQRTDVAARDARFLGDGEQARGARVVGLVVRMAETGNRPFRRAEPLRDVLGSI